MNEEPCVVNSGTFEFRMKGDKKKIVAIPVEWEFKSDTFSISRFLAYFDFPLPTPFSPSIYLSIFFPSSCALLSVVLYNCMFSYMREC
jgi:hypothetical protein